MDFSGTTELGNTQRVRISEVHFNPEIVQSMRGNALQDVGLQ